MIRSILFVCAGNICRSPIAEAAFRHVAQSRPALADVEVGSAGTIAMDGSRAAPEAIASARAEFGVDITRHRARNVIDLDADLILTMDRAVTREVLGMSKRGQVALLGDYAGTNEAVTDPYGCDGDTFQTCARHIRRLVELAVERIGEG
jgi:protein-tyrosine phosphatase